MGSFVANEVKKAVVNNGNDVNESEILVLGITFKENCPDIRNTEFFKIKAL